MLSVVGWSCSCQSPQRCNSTRLLQIIQNALVFLDARAQLLLRLIDHLQLLEVCLVRIQRPLVHVLLTAFDGSVRSSPSFFKNVLIQDIILIILLHHHTHTHTLTTWLLLLLHAFKSAHQFPIQILLMLTVDKTSLLEIFNAFARILLPIFIIYGTSLILFRLFHLN